MQFLGRWAYQKPIVDFAVSQKAIALFCEQGVGKTWITAGVIDHFLHDDYKALIVAPLDTIQSDDGWRFVLAKLQINVCLSWEEYKESDTPKILLLHYESIQPRRRKQSKKHPKPRGKTYSQKLATWIKRQSWSFVCFDESQKLKARNGAGSKVARGIKKSDYKLILTGTPFDDLGDNPQELWAQFRFLKPALFGTVWKNFAWDYLQRCGWMGKQFEFRPGALKRIRKMIQPYSLRVTKKVFRKEEPEIITIETPMFGKQRKLYERIEERWVGKINGETVTTSMKMVRNIRLQQIAGGFVKDDEGEIHEFGSTKLRSLKHQLEIARFPVIINARFIPEVNRIVNEVSSGKYRVSTITGDTRRIRGKIIGDFQAGKIDILVNQVRTGSLGINLQLAPTVFFYSTTWSYIDFYQAISRVDRAGQKNKVKIFLLVAKNSIDRDIYSALLSKRDFNSSFLSRFKRKETSMAKSKKSSKSKGKESKDKEKKKSKKDEGMKYGIKDLAEALEVEPATARVQLRKLKVEKVGGRYGWDSMSEIKALVKKIRAKAKAKEEEADDEDDDEDEDE